MSRSPYLHALELLAASRTFSRSEMLGASRAPVFGVTEERGPGGIIVPLLRCEIPVCDEWPSSSAAFYAVVDFHALWDKRRRETGDALGGAVSPQDAPPVSGVVAAAEFATKQAEALEASGVAGG